MALAILKSRAGRRPLRKQSKVVYAPTLSSADWSGERRKENSGELRPPLSADPIILILSLALVGFSMLMLYSTTGIISLERFGDPLYYVKRQGIAALLGCVLLFVGMRVPIGFLKKTSGFCLPACLVLLVLPLIPGVGLDAGGATRWVNLGFMRFQPGELVKLLFIIFLAGYFSRQESKLHTFTRGVLKPGLLVSLVGILYLLEPDFGSTAVVAGVTVCMALAAGVRLRYAILLVLAGGLCLGGLIVTSPYRLSRVMSFLAPWEDASGSGYQLLQSLIAVGSGELVGVGLGGSQQKLFFLPAAHTDFIFAVIAEELGFVGCVSVILCFLAFLWRGLVLAGRAADDTFSYCLSVGLTLLIVLPALLNIGVVIGVLPTKGMVLPLVGYGGTSLMTNLLGVGLLLSIGRYVKWSP